MCVGVYGMEGVYDVYGVYVFICGCVCICVDACSCLPIWVGVCGASSGHALFIYGI